MTKRKERDELAQSSKLAKAAKSVPKSSKDSFWLKIIEVSLGSDRGGSQIDYLQKSFGATEIVVNNLKNILKEQEGIGRLTSVYAEYYEPLKEDGLTIGKSVSTVFVPVEAQGDSVPQIIKDGSNSFFLSREDVICIYVGKLFSYIDRKNYKVFKAFKIKPIVVEIEEETSSEIPVLKLMKNMEEQEKAEIKDLAFSLGVDIETVEVSSEELSKPFSLDCAGLASSLGVDIRTVVVGATDSESDRDQAKSAEESDDEGSAASEPMSDVLESGAASDSESIPRSETPNLGSDDLPRGQPKHWASSLTKAAESLEGADMLLDFYHNPVDFELGLARDSCHPAGEVLEMGVGD